MLIIGSKSMRERLGIDAMASWRDTVLNRLSEDTGVLSADQVAQAALDRRNIEVEQQRMAQVGQVAVALEGMQAVAVKARLLEPKDETREALDARGPAMFNARPESRRCKQPWRVPCRREWTRHLCGGLVGWYCTQSTTKAHCDRATSPSAYGVGCTHVDRTARYRILPSTFWL